MPNTHVTGLVTIAGAAHAMNREKPADFNRSVRRFSPAAMMKAGHPLTRVTCWWCTFLQDPDE